MYLKEAIKRCDQMRPNTIDEEMKAEWLYELEGRLAHVMNAPSPERVWPEDSELSMPAPYEQVYERYLCAMIDLANQETDLYANDAAFFEQTWAEATAWWNRTHRPEPSQNWKVM